MEKDLSLKSFPWSTVVEYFTKRGKPLTKDDIQKFIAEDRLVKEQEEEALRVSEETEKRRM